ncbi:MAG: SUMF1/EgtB/PvdO family nonheme iron enzyme [Pseudomonadota bacterium]
MADSSSRTTVILFSLVVVAVLVGLDWWFGSTVKRVVLGTASVSVVTEPPGATVLADVTQLGVTPLDAATVLPGDYVLRIEHPHYLPQRERVSLARGDTVSRTLTLERGRGALRLVSNPRGATVTLDGEPLAGTTPLSFDDYPAGAYEAQFEIYGRRTVTRTIEVLPDAVADISVELNRVPMGSLVVATTPADATVTVLEAPVEYESGVMLPLGTYQVRVSRAGYGTVEERVELRHGPNRIAVALSRDLATLRLNVTPASAAVTVRAGGESQRVREFPATLELPTGEVVVSARRLGYRDGVRRLTLGAAGAEVALALRRFNVQVGRVFSDDLRAGGAGPKVVILAAGKFRMGDSVGDGSPDERPVHDVQLRAPFAIGVNEVTEGDWRAFDAASPVTDATLPKTGVKRDEIAAYLRWLSRQTGQRYRLPSEAEWEFAARAGSTGSYPPGGLDGLCGRANVADAQAKARFNQYGALDCSDGHVRLAPVGSFAANAFGLHDVIGNASEWVGDCWHGSFVGAPADGGTRGSRSGDCDSWVERGGAWNSGRDVVRLSYRRPASRADGDRGFRVLREL